METLRLILALSLPWILGVVCIRKGWQPGTPGAIHATLGYGFLCGILATALVMTGINAACLPQNYYLIIGILGLLAVGGIWATRRIPWFLPQSDGRLPAPAPPNHGITWRHVAVACFVALLMLRFSGFALEVLWRPLYPWDAWMNWAPRARVWFEHGTLIPFVSPREWAEGASPAAYTGSTAYNWNYPRLVSLVQLWMALAANRWDESLINLPWLLCGMALVLAFYGQARALGATPVRALFFCYLLASMPFTGTHIALAGYAELWVATAYALAAMAFLRWVDNRDWWQGAIALLLIAALPFIKQPGIAWAATFVPAVLVAVFPTRRLTLALTIIAVVLVSFSLTLGIGFTILGVGDIVLSPDTIRLPALSGEVLQFHPIWDPFFQNFFVLASWHLLWFLVPLTVLLFPFLRWDGKLAASTILLVSGLGFLFIVFFFTERYSREALDYTTLNRAVFHMVPALLFIITVIFIQLHRRLRQTPDLQPQKECSVRTNCHL